MSSDRPLRFGARLSVQLQLRLLCWMLTRFRAWGRANPFTLSLATATGKTAAADAMTQVYIEQRQEIDTRRLALFTAFGFGYLGCVQYWLYVRAFAAWFPAAARFGEHPTLAARLADRAGLRDLLLQTLAGNFLHIPLAFFPSFYVTQEVINQGSAASPRRALERYRQNAWDDLVAAWKIWIPGHLLFFSTPLWARLPTNHAMSFGFCCVLSFMRGSERT